MTEQLTELLNNPEFITTLLNYAMRVLGAVGVLILGWIVSSISTRLLRGLLDRSKHVDPTVKPILVKILKYLILIVTLVAALGQLGVATASLLAVLGAAGLAIGLALQGTLSNIAAGIMLLFLRPLRLGEYIEAESVAGTVKEIGLFTTILTTFDGVFLSAPNSKIWSSTIKNYSRHPTRRVDVPVGIAYEDDIAKGLSVLEQIRQNEPRILNDPAPQTMVLSLGDSSVNINLRCWVKTEDYWQTLFDLTRAVKIEIEQAGLTIPFPQRTLHVEHMQAIATASQSDA